MISKDNNLCFLKGVDLKFNNIIGSTLGQGKLKASLNLASWVLIIPSVLSANPDY